MSGNRSDAMRGITLIELLITLVILSIMLALAVGNFGPLIAQSRMTTGVNNLVGALTFARSLALTGKWPVTICPRKNNVDDCRDGMDWTKGAILFQDRNADQKFDAATDVLKRRWEAPNNIEITADVKAVTYNNNGTSNTDARWIFCDPADGVDARVVVVNVIGSNSLYKLTTCPE